MSAADVQHYFNLSAAVLDVEHPKQRGLTMRTIETLISEKKLITSNKNIINSNLYDCSRVNVINRDNPQLSNDFIDSPFLLVFKIDIGNSHTEHFSQSFNIQLNSISYNNYQSVLLIYLFTNSKIQFNDLF
jgi:hypothetical protein